MQKKPPQTPAKRSWTHPNHARGVRSPALAAITTELTNAKIDEYIRRGFYGAERQAHLLAAEAQAKARRRTRHPRRSATTDGEVPASFSPEEVDRIIDDII